MSLFKDVIIAVYEVDVLIVVKYITCLIAPISTYVERRHVM